MTSPKIKMRSKFFIFITLFVFIVASFIYSVISDSRSRINCKYEDIDILTARYRFQRYIFFIKVNEKIEETYISKTWKKHFGQYPKPDWRRVNTFLGIGRGYSPHHSFHGALSSVTALEKSFKMASFSEEAERKTIETFLQLLQKENNYFSASRYCSFIGSNVIDKNQGQAIEEHDIPSSDEWIEMQEETILGALQ